MNIYVWIMSGMRYTVYGASTGPANIYEISTV